MKNRAAQFFTREQHDAFVAMIVREAVAIFRARGV